MNSMSKGNWQEEKGCGCRKEKEDNRKKEIDDEVLLKCVSGNSQLLPTVAAGTTPSTFNLVSFVLNTSHFKNPCIKYEFASNILSNIPATATTALTINFQIFKRCRRDVAPGTAVGPVWTFTRPIGALNTADTFSFIVCDCGCDCDCDKDDCCTYTVVASVVTNPTTTAIINNPTFSALVVERGSRC
ncbi:DUF4489 domain-containing protein [Clostridium estertheticum]|uniref:DUF4489 domain-containing protein n=1 Tax=Clostridium estertheticum TaxID=238834 RepID=UPI001CF5B925|nr:DUF4489 domain-containing protein [Clostridium estertheticum]MCB2360115.1 DUF4489 domain-containing protein [Clostridium estertheticum]